MIRATVRPSMLRWARERAGATEEDLEARFPRLAAWERGEGAPTLKQLEAFAAAVWVPIGYLFLPDPPAEDVPIPDFRSGWARGERPTPNLLDTVYLCQERQDWYREHAITTREPPAVFVGSVRLETPVVSAAASMREALGFDLEARRTCATWTDALRQFIREAERLGVMAMCSGVVFNNNRRKLDPTEFRGFAIADPLAPLVFINGADTKASQMFTLAHELSHLWLGQTALSNADAAQPTDGVVETWCNQVAAELLVPEAVLRAELRPHEAVSAAMSRLARQFKVSTLVILRRIFDLGGVSRQRFHAEYEAELVRLKPAGAPRGGDFYLTQSARVSRRFASALIESTLEGRTLYRDAMRMLGISKIETFNQLARQLQFPL